MKQFGTEEESLNYYDEIGQAYVTNKEIADYLMRQEMSKTKSVLSKMQSSHQFKSDGSRIAMNSSTSHNAKVAEYFKMVVTALMKRLVEKN